MHNLEKLLLLLLLLLLLFSSSSSNLHNKKLQELHFLSNVMRWIKSRRMSKERHVARRRENFGGKIWRKVITRKIYA